MSRTLSPGKIVSAALAMSLALVGLAPLAVADEGEPHQQGHTAVLAPEKSAVSDETAGPDGLGAQDGLDASDELDGLDAPDEQIGRAHV